MDERIRGSFPGGPKHSQPQAARTRAPRVESVEEIETRRARRTLDRQSKHRRFRVLGGFVFASLAAGAVGALVGLESHHTPEEMSATQNASHGRDLDISWQVNRTLLQLWKMEDVQAAVNHGLSR
jgi:hypothetical protein